MGTVNSITNEQQQREYKDERFEFALYVNDNLVCKRNFRINNFIEGSMNSINFKETVDHIVKTIDDDLKSKSRVYTWYYSDFFEDFKDKPLEPWACTFKFEVTDNKNLVISKIWDGYAYSRAIRERVDIANKTVRIVTKDGMVYTFDKDEYFKENEGKLSTEMYVLKAMINDKQDLLMYITKKICETCSPHDDLYTSIDNYTTSVTFTNDDFEVKKKYFLSPKKTYNKYVSDWAKSVSEKTKKYFASLAEDDKIIRKYS